MAKIDTKNDDYNIWKTQDAGNVFKEFHKSHLYSDLTLICDEDETSFNSSAFQVHQILMASKSTYAARAIKNYNEQITFPHGKVILYLDGISKKILQLILDFVYVGSACVSQDDMGKFIDAAKRLQIQGLWDNEAIENLVKDSMIQKCSKSFEKEFKDEGKILAQTIKKEIINEENIFEHISTDNNSIDEIEHELTLIDAEEPKSTSPKRPIISTLRTPAKVPKMSNFFIKKEENGSLQFTQDMKSKVIEIQKVVEELTQKYYNQEERYNRNSCKSCPNKSVGGRVELKRHILTNHLKGKYEHILENISFCRKELTDDSGLCKLCDEKQNAQHFRRLHITQPNFVQSILGNHKKILLRSLKSLTRSQDLLPPSISITTNASLSQNREQMAYLDAAPYF